MKIFILRLCVLFIVVLSLTSDAVFAAKSDTPLKEAVRLYIDSINEAVKDKDWADDRGTMSLMYIDGDDIPELLIDWGFTAGESRICTVSNGELKCAYVETGGVSYIERQGVFLEGGGRQGVYYDKVYTLQNGQFEIKHSGEYGEEATDDEKNPYTYYWRWNGEGVTESEYKEKLQSVFDASKAVNSQENVFNAADILQKINALVK